MSEVELEEYIKAYKPLDGFPNASSVSENRVEVGRRAKVLV